MTPDTDVVVAGGGPAGVCAAVAAARAGARVTLLEHAAFLGGTATGAMVASFMGFYWRDERVVGGVAHEITRRLQEADGARGFTPYLLAEASESPTRVRTFPFDPEILKFVLDDLVDEAGIDLRLHSRATGVVPGAQGRVGGVSAQGRGAAEVVTAAVTVDATADAVLARAAGCRMQNADADPRSRQPMTAMARLSGVDVARFRALPRARKQELARRGVRSGELAAQLLAVVSAPHGTDAFILMTRVAGYDGADSRDLTAAEIAGRRQVRATVAFLRREVPGFEDARLAALAPWIGVRETWRVVGDHVLDEDDVLDPTGFADTVALGAGPLDVHDRTGGGLRLVEPPAPFPIPYRCLLPADADGLLVVGRCASATEAGMGAMRHMGTVMALGEAAGTAAALAVRHRTTPRLIDPTALRALLAEQGAVLDPRRTAHRSPA